MNREKGQVVVYVLATMFLAVVVLLMLSFKITPYGNVRAITQWGRLTGKVYEPGPGWIIPIMQGSERVSTQRVTYETSDHPDDSDADYTDFPIQGNTADGQQVTVKYTVVFQIASTSVVDVLNNIGRMNAIVENVIKAYSRSVAREFTQYFEAEELFSGVGRKEYQDDVFVELTIKYGEIGIELRDFLVRDIVFDPDYVQAIEQQQIAQEFIQTAEFQAEAEEFVKQQSIIQAEAERQRVILMAEAEQQELVLRAEGDAQATILNADANAYAIEVEGEALAENPTVLQLRFIEALTTINWAILPDNISPLLQLTTP